MQVVVYCLFSLILALIFAKITAMYTNEKIEAIVGKKKVFFIICFIIIFLFIISLNPMRDSFEKGKLVYMIFGSVYLSVLLIIADVDKFANDVQREVLFYGILVGILYVITLWQIGVADISIYLIYLVIISLALLLDIVLVNFKKDYSYSILIFAMCMYMAMYMTAVIFVITAIMTLLEIGIYTFLKKKVNNKSGKGNAITKSKKKVPFGFFLCSSNILIVIVSNFFQYYV